MHFKGGFSCERKSLGRPYSAVTPLVTVEEVKGLVKKINAHGKGLTEGQKQQLHPGGNGQAGEIGCKREKAIFVATAHRLNFPSSYLY